MYKQNEFSEQLEAALGKTKFMFPYSIDVSKDGKSAIVAAGTEDPDFPELYVVRNGEAYKLNDNGTLIDAGIRRAAWAENERDVLTFDDDGVGLLICNDSTTEVSQYDEVDNTTSYIESKLESVKCFI